jgi:hypothetical protein
VRLSLEGGADFTVCLSPLLGLVATFTSEFDAVDLKLNDDGWCVSFVAGFFFFAAILGKRRKWISDPNLSINFGQTLPHLQPVCANFVEILTNLDNTIIVLDSLTQ